MFAQKIITSIRKKAVHYLICLLLALVVGSISASIPGAFQNGYNMIVSVEDPDNGNTKKIERNYDLVRGYFKINALLYGRVELKYSVQSH